MGNARGVTESYREDFYGGGQSRLEGILPGGFLLGLLPMEVWIPTRRRARILHMEVRDPTGRVPTKKNEWCAGKDVCTM